MKLKIVILVTILITMVSCELNCEDEYTKSKGLGYKHNLYCRNGVVMDRLDKIPIYNVDGSLLSCEALKEGMDKHCAESKRITISE